MTLPFTVGDNVDLSTVRCDKQIEVLIYFLLHHNHIQFQLSEEPTEKILSNRKIVEAYNKKIAMESDPTVKIANIKQQVRSKVVWIQENILNLVVFRIWIQLKYIKLNCSFQLAEASKERMETNARLKDDGKNEGLWIRLLELDVSNEKENNMMELY